MRCNFQVVAVGYVLMSCVGYNRIPCGSLSEKWAQLQPNKNYHFRLKNRDLIDLRVQNVDSIKVVGKVQGIEQAFAKTIVKETVTDIRSRNAEDIQTPCSAEEVAQYVIPEKVYRFELQSGATPTFQVDHLADGKIYGKPLHGLDAHGKLISLPYNTTNVVEENNIKSISERVYKVSLNAGLGYAASSDGGALLLYLEPKYKLEDQLFLGIRIEEARIYGTSEAAIRSISIDLQRSFGNRAFKPYMGFGIGKFSGGMTFRNGQKEIGGTISTGVFPRVGLMVRQFNFSIDYNIISAKTAETSFWGFTLTENKPAFNYISFRIAMSIGK